MERKSYSIVSVFFITCGMKHNKSYTPPKIEREKIDGMDSINRILIIYHFIPFHQSYEKIKQNRNITH